jgi:putative exosortase-associated protein (TIGR04073 family)
VKRKCMSFIVVFLFIPMAVFAFDIKSDYDIEAEKHIVKGKIESSEVQTPKSPLNKLGRGLLNVPLFFMEVPASFIRVSRQRDISTGATVGMAQGVVVSMCRLATGLYDVITFPFPPYDKPMMKPEYVLQSADTELSEFMVIPPADYGKVK